MWGGATTLLEFSRVRPLEGPPTDRRAGPERAAPTGTPSGNRTSDPSLVPRGQKATAKIKSEECAEALGVTSGPAAASVGY